MYIVMKVFLLSLLVSFYFFRGHCTLWPEAGGPRAESCSMAGALLKHAWINFAFVYSLHILTLVGLHTKIEREWNPLNLTSIPCLLLLLNFLIHNQQFFSPFFYRMTNFIQGFVNSFRTFFLYSHSKVNKLEILTYLN